MTLNLDPLVSLEGDTDVIVRRDFTHPPARVWRALTEPALIRQWLGSNDLLRCEMDARTGGSFHFEWKAFHFSGPVLAADPPRRLVFVEHFNGDTTASPTLTTDLAPHGTGTRMTQVRRYASAEARAAAIAAGFNDGMDEVYARLEAVLGGE
ncbi:MAG TPA: SRPBCC domain-containing protein [Caulobacter sp.]|nr:SRPBCC domain-containing protein [Caulobacter sp.]